MEKSISEIFKGFSTLRVLIIGDVMLDSYIWGSVTRISPEAPVPIVQVKKRDVRLGGAANVALNIKALGATPVLVGLTGIDDDAKKLLVCLGENEIGKEGLVSSSDRVTTVKTRVMASHQHVVRVDAESEMEATSAEEKKLLEKIEQLIFECQVVIFEDYDKGTITPTIIEKTVALAKKKNIPVVVDPKKRNFLAYKNVDLFKPNLKELREGLKLDIDPSSPNQIEEAVKKLKEVLSASGVMLTLSEHGIFIDHKGVVAHLPAHVREIADVSGAGDTVVSIAALCLALGLDARQIAHLSNLGGGLVCQHVGVVPIDRTEFLSEATKH